MVSNYLDRLDFICSDFKLPFFEISTATLIERSISSVNIIFKFNSNISNVPVALKNPQNALSTLFIRTVSSVESCSNDNYLQHFYPDCAE